MPRTLALAAMIAVGAAGLAAIAAMFFLLAPSPGDSPPAASVSAPPTASAIPTASPAPDATVANPAPAPATPVPTCSDDVLTCVNEARAASGLAPLTADATLNSASQSCAERIAAEGALTHSSPTPGFTTWGENIASGYPSALDVFTGWMGSDGHRSNILSPNYTVMGIGHVSGGNYWCQQFGA